MGVRPWKTVVRVQETPRVTGKTRGLRWLANNDKEYDVACGVLREYDPTSVRVKLTIVMMAEGGSGDSEDDEARAG